MDAHNCSQWDGGRVDTNVECFCLLLPGSHPADEATGEWSPSHDEYTASAACNKTQSCMQSSKHQPACGKNILKINLVQLLGTNVLAS